MSLFPMFLKLEGRGCLIVGAGNVALEKIISLLGTGARLRVIAPVACEAVEQLAVHGKITLELREFLETDLEGQSLVVTATNSRAVNRQVFLAAQQRGLLCNSVDDPPNCDFYFPAIVRRGDLQVAISTAGESPAFAQRLRGTFESAFDQHLGDWLGAIGQIRREILASYPASEARKRALHLLANGDPGESQQSANNTSGSTP